MIKYQICTKCVMDTSHLPEIKFNDEGICSYCQNFKNFQNSYLKKLNKEKEFSKAIELMKKEGVGKDYDCLLGLSGGVDSSYLALKLHENGIRPLLIQLDNGWNTELATKNIQLIAEKFNFDLITYVINWEEFRDIQLSFMKASVRNLEAPSDHAIFATIYNTAIKHKIKYVISGVNYQTEFTSTKAYGHSYSDLIQINDIHNKFGTTKRDSFPTLPYWKRIAYDLFFSKIQYVTLLNFMDYNKENAINELIEKIDWKPYSGKHFESTITIFHQSYYLPVKFGLDKRRLHLSDIIRTGLISRENALIELEKPILDEFKLKEIIKYVAKKFELTEDQLINIINQPEVPYTHYANYDKQVKYIAYILKFLIKIKKIITWKK
jgi:N-acetyl sugar amidotransferase